jgi:hypothetical protein
MTDSTFDLNHVLFNLLFNATTDRPGVYVSISELVDEIKAKTHHSVTDEQVAHALKHTPFRQHQRADGAYPYDLSFSDHKLSGARLTDDAKANERQYVP